MQIHPINALEGQLESSPSKSYSHRAFALSLLATTPSKIIGPLTEGDLAVTIDFCQKFGAQIQQIPVKKTQNTSLSSIEYNLIPPKKLQIVKAPINGKNSGTSIRIMSALATLCEGETQIFGTFFNRGRPIQQLLDALAQIGVQYENTKDPFGVILRPPKNPQVGLMKIPGDISSQFITGLLCLAPQLHGHETEIRITTPAKSYPYLLMTEEILKQYGIQFHSKFDSQLRGSYFVPGNQNYPGITYYVPGDFSSAAFIMVAAAINPEPREIQISNIDMNSLQGDKEIVDILKRTGADIQIDSNNNIIRIKGGQTLHGIKINCSQIPDLFPIICVLGAFCHGETVIYNAEHVRLKETDRIKVMNRELTKAGVHVEEKQDGIIIQGPQKPKGSAIQHDQDHRIAMAMTISAMFASSPSTIQHPEVVKDSYPNFYEDITRLGAKIN